MLYSKQNNQIVSRVPAVASIVKAIFIPKQFNQIVSRETILSNAEEGETILAQAKYLL